MPPCMRTIAGILCACILLSAHVAGAEGKGLTVKGVRFFSYPGFTRIVFETESAAPYVMTRSGDGRSLYFSSYGGPFAFLVPQPPTINDGVVKGLAFRQEGDQRAVIIPLAPAAGESRDFVLRSPDRIVLDVFRGSPASPPAGGRSATVVIDPGHGGPDDGLITGQGPEKAITLDLARALRRALRSAGTTINVVLTREKDRNLTADERAAASDAADAVVFISLHVAQGSGSRVFILDPDEGRTLPGARTPNDFLGFDAVSDQQQALWGMQQAEYAQESGKLGRDVLRSLRGEPAAEPDQAPLAVLKPVGAAAVLVELGIAGNRTKNIDAIARGIEQYVRERR
jgi:N-acetylmuramoyl-L-alanine amidase